MITSNMAAHLPDVIDEGILCCPLCLRDLQQPKVLPCLHLFCLGCLEDYVKRWVKVKAETSGGTDLQIGQYFTFRESPVPADDSSSKRVSGGSDDSQKKRFERYTNADTLAKRGQEYREKIKKRTSKVQFNVADHDDENKDKRQKDRKAVSTHKRRNSSKSAANQKDKSTLPSKQSGEKPALAKKPSMDDVEKFYKTTQEQENEVLSLTGRVSNIVDLYEKKSTSTEMRQPPVAVFRNKIKTQQSLSFVPLHERPIPSVTDAPRHQNSRTPLPRSRSVDAPFKGLQQTSVLPRSISLNTQKSIDFTANQHPTEAMVPIEENIYEGYEVPENLKRLKVVQPNMVTISDRESGFYELAKAADSLPRHKSSTDALISSQISVKLKSKESKSKKSKDKKAINKSTISPPILIESRSSKIPYSVLLAQPMSLPLPTSPLPTSPLPTAPLPTSLPPTSLPPTASPPPASLLPPTSPSPSLPPTSPSPPSSPTEPLYHEIAVLRNPKVKTLESPNKCLLKRTLSKDDHDVDKEKRRLKRRSTILELLVPAGAFSKLKKSETDDLNAMIPLTTEVDNRMSHMYMKMDGLSSGMSPRKYRQESYMSMSGLVSPTISALDLPFKVESVDTLIRSLSNDVFEEVCDPLDQIIACNEESEEVEDPMGKMYENGEELELDMPIPIYDSPKKARSGSVSNPTYDESKAQQSSSKDSKHRAVDKDRNLCTSAKKDDIQVPCPTCQRLFPLPDNQVAALQNCSFAAQMQEVVLTQKCEKKQCGHCETKTAAYKCLDCQIYLCSGCHNGHYWSRSNKGHQVMTLQELQSGKFQQEIKELLVTPCDIDQTKEARHFCGQCNVLMCSDCRVDHSSTHRCCPLEEVADRDQDYIQSSTAVLQARIDTFQGSIDSLSSYQSHCRETQAQVLDQINSHQQFTQLLLNQGFDFLRAKVAQEFNAEVEKTEDVKQGVRQSLESMNYVSKFVKQLVEHGNHGNVVSMATILKQEFSRLQTVMPQVMDSHMKMDYCPPEVVLQDIQPACGGVTIGRDEIREVDPDKNKRSTQLVDSHTLQMAMTHSFATVVDSDKKGCQPTGMAMTPEEDTIIIVDDINKKLKAFDFAGHLKWEIIPEGQHALVDPWDVAVLADGTLAVTDKGAKCVKVFDRAGKIITSFGPHFKMPWGIATNTKGEILVSDTELCRVFIHDHSGRLLFTLPTSDSLKRRPNSKKSKFLLQCPEYVCTNSRDDVIVSDFESHCILVFDSIGRELFKFGKKGKGMEEFYHPLGVATDTNGNIYVVDYSNQRITVVTRNGQYHCCLATKHGLNSIQTLSVTKDGQLVVSDGTKVKIFTLPSRVCPITQRPPELPDRNGPVFLLQESEDAQENENVGKETSV